MQTTGVRNDHMHFVRFMCAVADGFDPVTKEPNSWKSFCRIGTGYTYAAATRPSAWLPCCRAAVRGPFPDHAGPVWRDVVRVFFCTHARHACHFYDSIGVSIELNCNQRV